MSVARSLGTGASREFGLRVLGGIDLGDLMRANDANALGPVTVA
jgi:hypothetical protein